MKKFIFPLLFIIGIFIMPSLVTSAADLKVIPPSWYQDKKNQLNSYFEIKFFDKTNNYTSYYILDGTPYKAPITPYKFSIGSDSNGDYLYITGNNSFGLGGFYYRHDSTGKIISGSNSPSLNSFNYSSKFYISGSGGYSTQEIFPLSYKNIDFDIFKDGVFPPPPNIDDEGNYGYNFIYPKNGDVINLHASSDSNYYKVPFRIDVKDYLASGLKKSEEFIIDNSRINNYKTVIDKISWIKKPNILGSDVRFFLDGYFYIPVSSLNTQVTLSFTTFKPDNITWIGNNVIVKFTSDGSLPEYNPDVGDSGGNVGNDGSVNVGGEDFGQIPQAPKDGDLGSWLSYIGNLLIWLVTYPFKLLGNIITTLVGYINGMFSILQPVTNQLNSVLSFIPSDILNVCWGFLSFTLLYSVIKSVMKMIRG